MTKTNKAPDTVALPKAPNGHGGARPKAGRKTETVADASGESKVV